MSDQQTSRLGFSPLLSRWALRGHSRGQQAPSCRCGRCQGAQPPPGLQAPLSTPCSARGPSAVSGPWSFRLTPACDDTLSDTKAPRLSCGQDLVGEGVPSPHLAWDGDSDKQVQ